MSSIFLLSLKNLERPLVDLQREARKIHAEAKEVIRNNSFNGSNPTKVEHAKQVLAFTKAIASLNMDEYVDAEWDKRGFPPAFVELDKS